MPLWFNILAVQCIFVYIVPIKVHGSFQTHLQDIN